MRSKSIYLCTILIDSFWFTAQNEGDSKRLKTGGSNENRQPKADGEGNSVKPAEPSKQDYIHVRARRGQATDSHSLAERVIFLMVVLIYTLNFGYLCTVWAQILLQTGKKSLPGIKLKLILLRMLYWEFVNIYSINYSDMQARREKISERMKILQDLVPGCNKVCMLTYH